MKLVVFFFLQLVLKRFSLSRNLLLIWIISGVVGKNAMEVTINFACSMVPKSKFVQMKNDQIDFEPFEKCIKCFRKWHRVCALFNKKVSHYHLVIPLISQTVPKDSFTKNSEQFWINISSNGDRMVMFFPIGCIRL